MDYRHLPPGRQRGILYSKYLQNLRRRNIQQRNIQQRNIMNLRSRILPSILRRRRSIMSQQYNVSVSISPIVTTYYTTHTTQFDMNDLQDVKIGLINKKLLLSSTVEKNKDEDKVCVICQDNIDLNDIVRTIKCKHSFHINCIDQWFTENKKCPICKFEI
jgi:hypothetical protein